MRGMHDSQHEATIDVEMTSPEISESNLRRCNMSSEPFAKRPAGKNMDMRARAKNLLHPSPARTQNDHGSTHAKTCLQDLCTACHAKRLGGSSRFRSQILFLQTRATSAFCYSSLTISQLQTVQWIPRGQDHRYAAVRLQPQQGDSGSICQHSCLNTKIMEQTSSLYAPPQSGAWPQTRRGRYGQLQGRKIRKILALAEKSGRDRTAVPNERNSTETNGLRLRYPRATHEVRHSTAACSIAHQRREATSAPGTEL